MSAIKLLEFFQLIKYSLKWLWKNIWQWLQKDPTGELWIVFLWVIWIPRDIKSVLYSYQRGGGHCNRVAIGSDNKHDMSPIPEIVSFTDASRHSNTLRPGQNDRLIADVIIKYNILTDNYNHVNHKTKLSTYQPNLHYSSKMDEELYIAQIYGVKCF